MDQTDILQRLEDLDQELDNFMRKHNINMADDTSDDEEIGDVVDLKQEEESHETEPRTAGSVFELNLNWNNSSNEHRKKYDVQFSKMGLRLRTTVTDFLSLPMDEFQAQWSLYNLSLIHI